MQYEFEEEDGAAGYEQMFMCSSGSPHQSKSQQYNFTFNIFNYTIWAMVKVTIKIGDIQRRWKLERFGPDGPFKLTPFFLLKNTLHCLVILTQSLLKGSNYLHAMRISFTRCLGLTNSDIL